MSEKFWLDWKEYDYQRMQDFILVHNITNKPTKDGGNSAGTQDGRRMNGVGH